MLAVVVVSLERQKLLVYGHGKATVKNTQKTRTVIIVVSKHGVSVLYPIESIVTHELKIVVTQAAAFLFIGINHSCMKSIFSLFLIAPVVTIMHSYLSIYSGYQKHTPKDILVHLTSRVRLRGVIGEMRNKNSNVK